MLAIACQTARPNQDTHGYPGGNKDFKKKKFVKILFFQLKLFISKLEVFLSVSKCSQATSGTSPSKLYFPIKPCSPDLTLLTD